jgi:hypothetical protein
MSGNRTMAGCETMPRSAAGSSVSFDEGVDAAEAVLHRDIECVLPSLRGESDRLSTVADPAELM